MVGMADLREFLSELGFTNARSLLQSGNLLFEAAESDVSRLERRLETEAAARLDLKADFIVRSGEKWRAVIENNPFPTEARRDPGHLLVMFCKEEVDQAKVAALQTTVTGPEVLRHAGREVYIVFPEGVGRSRLTHSRLEKELGTRATGRNWNTVLRLGALVTS
jgi:uncharacterized protein (DUF1697 family)